MLMIPTAPWAHTLFDVLAWAASALTGTMLHRWRLLHAAKRLAKTTGPGYFTALAAGALAGAWVLGSANTLRMGRPSCRTASPVPLPGRSSGSRSTSVPSAYRDRRGRRSSGRSPLEAETQRQTASVIAEIKQEMKAGFADIKHDRERSDAAFIAMLKSESERSRDAITMAANAQATQFNALAESVQEIRKVSPRA